MYPTPGWDGHSCNVCLARTSDMAYTTDEPCEACGWYTAVYTGERYPPGFCGTSWSYAKERIDILEKEFPKLSRNEIVNAVRQAGENDMECNDARAILGKVSSK